MPPPLSPSFPCADFLNAHTIAANYSFKKRESQVFSDNSLSLSVLQEAVSTRDPELVRLVLRYRDYHRAVKRLAGIPLLLEKLRQVKGVTPGREGGREGTEKSQRLGIILGKSTIAEMYCSMLQNTE